MILASGLPGCMRTPGKAGGPAAYPQGLFGRFEVIGGAEPAEEADCAKPASPTARDTCEQDLRKREVWPLKGYAVIRDARGDSTVLALDTQGGYRLGLPAGFYTVCVEAEGISQANLCQDGIEVKAGEYSSFSRPFRKP